MVETIIFLEALVRALGEGWSARYGLIAPYGVFGVVLTSDAGQTAEVVPSLVRGEVVVWSPFVFARGVPHYDLHTDDGTLLRTPSLIEAVERLERWRGDRGAVGRMATRLARAGTQRSRRAARRTEVDERGGDFQRADMVTPVVGLPAVSPKVALDSLADALRDRKLGQIDLARKLARRRDRGEAVGELVAIARRATGAARANALGVLVAVARPEDGPAFARYLDDAERSVQSAAVDGVKRTRYVAAIPALAALVVGRDARPRSAKTQLAASAATAMKALSGKRGAAALTGYLSSDDPRIREAACVAITMLASPGKRARPLLERLLADRDAKVAKAAKRALAAL